MRWRLFLIVLGLGVGVNKMSWNQTQSTMRVGSTTLQVEVARTPQAIEQGLSGRTTIGADGMLFELPRRGIPRFWMKEMQFALDFIWIDGTQVVDMTEHVPPPEAGTPEEKLMLYAPKQPITHVLEVPAGFIQQHIIHVGDSVQLNVR